MGRRVRSSNIETRSARLRLKPRPDRGMYKAQLVPGRLHLGYRPSERRGDAAGQWYGGVYLGGGRYRWQALGAADDHHDADGEIVLSYAQAHDAALALLEERAPKSAATVADAADAYLKWFRHERKGIASAEATVEAHIRPALGDRPVADLTRAELKAWLARVARAPARLRTGKTARKQAYRGEPETDDAKRARRATANRILGVLKALLNHAVEHELAAPGPWRELKPFKNVDEAAIRFLSEDETTRLVNACPPDLRRLVRGALNTGCRFGELAGMTVADVDAKGARVYVAPAKSGRARHVPLSAEGARFFAGIATGRAQADPVFAKENGGAWGKNDYQRAWRAACRTAKIDLPGKAAKFHDLRHAYASQLINRGVDLAVVSKLLGHADTRITLKHYAHLADATLRKAVARLPDFGQEPEGNVRAIR